eukprot:scpid23280/ scgid21298/ 
MVCFTTQPCYAFGHSCVQAVDSPHQPVPHNHYQCLGHHDTSHYSTTMYRVCSLQTSRLRTGDHHHSSRSGPWLIPLLDMISDNVRATECSWGRMDSPHM